MKQILLFSLLFMLSACSVKSDINTTETNRTIAMQTQDSQHLIKRGTDALVKNRTDLAEAYFTDALQNMPWYQRYWPFTATLHYHLATTYMRVDDFAKASDAYDKAAGPFGIKSMQVRSEQLNLFKDQKVYEIEGATEVHLPFVALDPLPVVQVSVEGSKPVNFFIDTGGEEIILDKAFANTLDIKIIGEIEGEYAGAKKGITGFGKIDSLALGEMSVHHIPIQTLDLAPTNKHIFKELEVKGVIGTRFLMHFLSTIDYKNRQLTLKTDKKYQPSGNAVTIPFSLYDTHLIFAEGAFNGKNEGLYFIDTGLAGAGFLSSQKLLKASNVMMDWSKAKIGAGGGGEAKALEVAIDEVRLGNGKNSITKNNLKGVVFEEDISLFKDSPLGFEVKGLISHAFFLGYAVTFDFEKMVLHIEQK